MNIIHVTSPEKKLHFVSRVGIASKPHQKYANYVNDSNIVVHYFFFYVASNVWQNGNGPGAIYYNIILCKSAIVLQCFLC